MFDFDTSSNEIFLYDEIGPEWAGMIGASSVRQALSQMSGRVTVRLNTPGGSVDEGIAIFNELKRYPGGVDTVVDSIAYSMGSYILQVGETRTVTRNAMVMIHDPWIITWGDAKALRKEADVLDKYKARMLPDYASRSGASEETVAAMMTEEAWMPGAESVEQGYADVVEGDSVEPVAISEATAAHFRELPSSINLKNPAAGSKTPYPRRREMAKRKMQLLG